MVVRLICLVLAIGSWVLGCILLDNKFISGPLAIPIVSAIFWFFVCIAICGKKGAAVGAGILTFALCAIVLLSVLAKVPYNSRFLNHPFKLEHFFFWLGVALCVFVAIMIPAKIMIKLWKKVK